MTIKHNSVVSVNYHLSANPEGETPELVEQTTKENPFVFLFGSGQLLPDFEKNLINKKIGVLWKLVFRSCKQQLVYRYSVLTR